jgi:Undecaprenyl-phosphate glucose phosphotransferase
MPPISVEEALKVVRTGHLERPRLIQAQAAILAFTLAFRVCDLAGGMMTGYLFFRFYCTFETNFWPLYGNVSFTGAVLAILIFQIAGCYQTDQLKSRRLAVRTLLAAFFWFVMVWLAVGFLSKSLNDVSRVWSFLWLTSWLALCIAVRECAVRTLQARMAEGDVVKRVALVGAGEWGEKLHAHLLKDKRLGVLVVGVFDDRRGRAAAGLKQSVRPISDLLEIGRRVDIDQIVLTFPIAAETRILEISNRLMALSADVCLCPDVTELSLLRRPVTSEAGMPVIQISRRPLSEWRFFAKLAQDKLLALVFLLCSAPILALIALLIKIDGPGPVLFRQLRHGYNNREFEVLKFRTMRIEAHDPSGARQTQRNDRRVTPLGRFLRRTSLDELPQFVNVLRGDMSIVGPRPLPIGMLTQDRSCQEIVQQYAHRHRVRPGITGWAQVNGYRGATESAEQLRKRVELDMFYIENWSMVLDAKILFFTSFRFLLQENAY